MTDLETVEPRGVVKVAVAAPVAKRGGHIRRRVLRVEVPLHARGKSFEPDDARAGMKAFGHLKVGHRMCIQTLRQQAILRIVNKEA